MAFSSIKNKCMFTGFVVRKPEGRNVSDGKGGTNMVTNFSLGVNEGGKNSKIPSVFPEMIAWGKQAEIIVQYADKGTLMQVEGKMQTDKYEDKDGKPQQRIKFQLVDFAFLNQGKNSEAEGDEEETLPVEQPSPARRNSSSNKKDDGGEKQIKF